MLGLRTLVLNANYMPVSYFPRLKTIPVEEAITRVLNGTCHVVFEYDRKIKHPTMDMCWPSVIARNKIEEINFKVGNNVKRDFLYYRDHGICVYCEKTLESYHEVTYDHVVPLSRGGSNGWENIVSACTSCNNRKGNHMPAGEWKPKLSPYKPTIFELIDRRRKFPITVDDENWAMFLGDWHAPITVGNTI